MACGPPGGRVSGGADRPVLARGLQRQSAGGEEDLQEGLSVRGRTRPGALGSRQTRRAHPEPKAQTLRPCIQKPQHGRPQFMLLACLGPGQDSAAVAACLPGSLISDAWNHRRSEKEPTHNVELEF